MTQMRVRVDRAAIEQADSLIEFVRRSPAGQAHTRVTRSTVIRIALGGGLADLAKAAKREMEAEKKGKE